MAGRSRARFWHLFSPRGSQAGIPPGPLDTQGAQECYPTLNQAHNPAGIGHPRQTRPRCRRAKKSETRGHNPGGVGDPRRTSSSGAVEQLSTCGTKGDRVAVCCGNASELRVAKLLRLFGLVERGTVFARGEGDFPPGGPGEPRPSRMPSFGLFLGISLVLEGVMTSRDTGLETAIKMSLSLGSTVPFRPISSHSLLLIWKVRRVCRAGDHRVQAAT